MRAEEDCIFGNVDSDNLPEILGREVLTDLTKNIDDVLIQVWFPCTDADGNQTLQTRHSPYVIMGSGDEVRHAQLPFPCRCRTRAGSVSTAPAYVRNLPRIIVLNLVCWFGWFRWFGTARKVQDRLYRVRVFELPRARRGTALQSVSISGDSRISLCIV